MVESTKNKELIIKMYNRKLTEIKYNVERYNQLEKQMNKLQEVSNVTSAKSLEKDNKEQKIWDEESPVYKILIEILKERSTKGIVNMDDINTLKTIQNSKMMDLATKINKKVEITNDINEFLKEDLGIPVDSTVIEWKEKGIQTPSINESVGKNLMLNISKNMWEITKIIDGGITMKDRENLLDKVNKNVSLGLEKPREAKGMDNNMTKNGNETALSKG